MLDWLGIPAPADIWGNVVGFFTLSPFWLYLVYGLAIIACALVLSWLFPVLRSLAGAVVVAVVGMLYAYRKGEKDAERREADRRAREARRARPRPQYDNWWRW